MDDSGQKNVLDFFNKHGQEGADAVAESFDSAESQQRVNLSVSGRYRMRVATFGYVKDNAFKSFPNMYESTNKKALMLTVSLRVIDGTPLVPKGASMFHNITLAPAAGAKAETIEAIARISKPQLVALFGKDNIKATPDWLIENCLPVFEKDGDTYKLKKDHNLQAEVMVEVVDDYYNNRETLKVNSIFPANPADKSISNQPQSLKDIAGSGKRDTDGEVISDGAAEDIVDTALGDDTIEPDSDDVIEAGTETPEGNTEVALDGNAEAATGGKTEDF